MEIRKTVKLRAETKGNTLFGYASVYDTETFIPGEGYEIMARSAFDEVSKQETDVIATLNHNPSLLLGTERGKTLKWSTDSEGLPFEVELPDTTVGRDVRVLLERGDLNGCSFAWIEGDFEYQARSAGGRTKVHTRVDRLVDVSVVTLPAYPGTSAKLRAEQNVTFDRDPRSRLIKAKFNLQKGRHV